MRRIIREESRHDLRQSWTIALKELTTKACSGLEELTGSKGPGPRGAQKRTWWHVRNSRRCCRCLANWALAKAEGQQRPTSRPEGGFGRGKASGSLRLWLRTDRRGVQHGLQLRSLTGSSGDIAFGVQRGTLVSRLRLDLAKDKDFIPLPVPLLRKYIAYGRTFIFPRPAAEILQKFYLRLRDHNTSADSTPITARQLESLDVVEIMKESLYDEYMDEHGFLDFTRCGGMSEHKEAKRFLTSINKQSELQQKDCFKISEIYGLADRIGLRVPDLDIFIDNLNSAGYFLKKGPKLYQGSLGALVDVFPCDLEVTGSSPGSSHLQKCRVRLIYISHLWWHPFPNPCCVGMLCGAGCPFAIR
ncbi:hypothetical protein KSP40_PGU003679 [Platanthera guangdongensis]|uniref:DNA helicase n=1 Tax=Platanthera guangdongensis TaxID=2320717 RepID=A0ABR2M5L3_9ASPA